MQGLVAEGRAITAAYRQSMAFHDGKALKGEYDRWQASLRLRPGQAAGTLSEDDEATIARIIARWQTQPAEVS